MEEGVVKKKGLGLAIGLLLVLSSASVFSQEPSLEGWLRSNGYSFAPGYAETFQPGRYRVTLLARFSGQSNELGFYYTYRSEHPLSFGGLRPLISSTAPVGFSTEFTASHEFGLYLNSIADAAHSLGGLFWTEHRYNWDKRSHAKIYSVGYNRWVVGWEDWADFDYNDMIVLIERVEVPVHERTVFSDSFDSYPDGSLPYGWEVVWGGIDYGVSSRYSVSGKSFRLRGRDHWTCGIQRRFSSDARLIGYEFDILIEGWGNRGSKSRGRDHADHPGFFCKECATWGAYYASVLFVHRDGSIRAEDGTVLGRWVPGRWYHVRVLLDRQANTYSVWVDGRLVGSNLRTRRSDTYNIRAFILVSGWSETNVYYDNVKVFELKEPSLPYQTPPAPPPGPAACSVSLWVPSTWYPAGSTVTVRYVAYGRASVLRLTVVGPWTWITDVKMPVSPGTWYSRTFRVDKGTYTVTVEATCADGAVVRDSKTITAS